jgi:CBS domain-containing protein
MSKNMQRMPSKKEKMIVKDYMTKNPDYLTPETTIKEAAVKMSELNTGSLPIGNEVKLLGFVTDRDITIKAVAEGLDIEETTIDKIMNNKVLYCFENDELEKVIDNMQENKVLRLVVLDDEKQFVGVINHSQIAKAAVDEKDEQLCEKTAELACYNKLY